MSDFWIRTIQLTVFAAVGCSSIYFEQSTGYEISPFIIAAWSFMAAYAATLGMVKISDLRSRKRGAATLGSKKRTDVTL